MITFKQGNLLDAKVDAVVNTVNTVGVMGKGIALMFKERFPENFKAYEAACKAGEVQTGKMFVTSTGELDGPKWVINFPTKKHWRHPSRVEWIVSGLDDLRRAISELGIRSIALPPLGCGNGGLDWAQVKGLIEEKLGTLEGIEVIAFEPTHQYQNVAKRSGVSKLTIPRALIAECVRRYSVLGIECTLLEIQKLAWFLERCIVLQQLENELDLQFEANRYGPFSSRLNHLLNALDGSYLTSSRRVTDCSPCDTIQFNQEKKELVQLFLSTGTVKPYEAVVQRVDALIDGFQSPFGLELLSTVDWLLHKEKRSPDIPSIRQGLAAWKGGLKAGERKQKLFNDHALQLALDRLLKFNFV